MIDTMDKLIAAMTSGQRIVFQKASATTVANFYYSLWSTAGIPSAGAITIGNTSSGVIPTDTTTGAPIINAFTGTNTGYALTWDVATAQAGVVSLYDRLYHVGSILLNSLATTTLTSQPTLTRIPNNDYSQVEMWLEMNVACSSTATTVTVSYQDGNNTTQTATLDTNLSAAPTLRMLPFRLANSTGVQKINSVTVGGTVATAGSINIVLQRNLADMTIVSANISRPKQNPFDMGMPIIYADSCLALMFLATTTSSGTLFGELVIGNG